MSQDLLSIKETEKWNRYFYQLPSDQQDIYFTPEYYKIYQKYGDGEVFCFVFKKGNDIAIYPFLKNPVDKKTFKLDKQCFDIQGAYGYNGVISSNYESDFVNDFYKQFNSFCVDEGIIAEFTRFHPLINNHLFSKNHLNTFLNRQTVVLNLNRDIDKIWKDSYSSKNRNMLRKAEKNGLEVCFSEDIVDYISFYKLYLQTMREIGSLEYYYFNEDYIRNFNAFLGQKQKLILAKYQGQIIAGMLLMIENQYAHYHLSSRDKNYSSLAGNNFILDRAIRIAIDSGVKYFHFGGGNSDDPKDPLFKFKANFSKETGDFYIGKKIYNGEIYSQVCNIWEKKYPELKNKYANFLLKYKETE
ncbi:MAG: GNAT family N-acetyltransferase [Bacteroidota bacterium]